VFEISEMTPHPPPYDIHLLSEQGGPLKSLCGLVVETEAFGNPGFDTIIVGAITSFVMPGPSTAHMLAFAREAAKASRRTASFCNGAFVLAEAGLLDGQQLRLEAARFMMEEGRHTVNEVAQQAGFGDRERMRRAFIRAFGVSAEAMRRKASAGASL
jgi:transcriptional regulator GlxA family with amidase domain